MWHCRNVSALESDSRSATYAFLEKQSEKYDDDPLTMEENWSSTGHCSIQTGVDGIGSKLVKWSKCTQNHAILSENKDNAIATNHSSCGSSSTDWASSSGLASSRKSSSWWPRWPSSPATAGFSKFFMMGKEKLRARLVDACKRLCFYRNQRKPLEFRTVIPNHVLEQCPGASHSSNKHHPNLKYACNKIRTTKYTWLTFLPKNLFEQFHRYANLYFVFIVLLNYVPQVGAFDRFIALVPILFVLSVTAVKDAFEDHRRYRLDRQINHMKCLVYSSRLARFEETEWQHLIVGDIIRLSANSVVPADVVLLYSSDPSGTCYVETSNLDGETSLKQRQVVPSLLSAGIDFDPTLFTSTIECEQPNNQLYKFNGFILHKDGQRESVNRNNLLLRGSSIRNTDYVIGIIVYAGKEAKSMLNSSGPRYKRSNVEKRMNKDIVGCFFILFTFCFIGCCGYGIWLNQYTHLPLDTVPFISYATQDTSVTMEAFVIFWTYVIVLQTLIPISLYVTIEIVKLGQVYFITQDLDLYDEKSDKRLQCRALNIPEELGQVQYVLSDKTGTLTENRMIFRRCVISGKDYGPPETADADPSFRICLDKTNDGKAVYVDPHLCDIVFRIFAAPDTLSNDDSFSPTSAEQLIQFFLNLAICNTVVVNPRHGARTIDTVSSSSASLNSSTVSLSTSATQDSGLPRDDARTESYVIQVASSSVRPSIDCSSLAPPDNGATALRSAMSVSYLSAGNNVHGTFLSETCNSLTTFSLALPILSASDSQLLSEKDTSILVPDANSQNNQSSSDAASKDEDTVGLNDVAAVSPVFKEEASTPTGTDAAKASGAGGGSQCSVVFQPVRFSMTKVVEWSKVIKLRFPIVTKRSATRHGISEYKNPIYEAESPDELAIVYAAAAYGFRLMKRGPREIFVELPNRRVLRYEIVHVLPFDSVRRRMSVILRNPFTNDYVLYCKGADSSVMQLLAPPTDQWNSSMDVHKTDQWLNMYASYGLRTLCMAKRELSPDVYQAWLEKHQDAESALDNRDQLLHESATRIEQHLQLLGVTGIEDRLQHGVPECISSLREARIKVWVLTGDKIETAVNVSYACKLFAPEMDLVQISVKNKEDAAECLQYNLRRFEELSFGDVGLVIDGRSLAYCLHPVLVDSFLQLASQCNAVLCCRITPLQKASVVKVVKSKLHAITLAIGDGANDVPMIQCADVGVGISGQEGMQAVMASDYAMPRFSYLKRLLLVHGHWCYDRLARVILYFIYKNAMPNFIILWFQFFCGFSAQVMIDPTYLQLYNLAFTSLPPIVFALLDQDVNDAALMQKPNMYTQGSEKLLYNSRAFCLNILDAAWQSLVIYFIAYCVTVGSSDSLWSFGFLITSALVVVCQVHLLIVVNLWNWPLIISTVGSILVFYFYASCYNMLAVTCCTPDPPYMVAQHVMVTGSYWLTLLLIVVGCILPRILYRSLLNTLSPSDVVLAQIRSKHQLGNANRLARFWACFSRTKRSPVMVSG